MNMELLAYTSRAAPGVDGSDVFGIVAASARNNVEARITGILFFKDSSFFQIVEGPSESLDRLLSVLAMDTRHSDLRIKARLGIARRHFPEWNMKRISNLNASEESADVRSKIAAICDSDELSRELARFFHDARSEAA